MNAALIGPASAALLCLLAAIGIRLQRTLAERRQWQRWWQDQSAWRPPMNDWNFFMHCWAERLAAQQGQLPTFEQVLADLTARRPARAALLALAAHTLHQELQGWIQAQERTTSATAEPGPTDWPTLCAQLQNHPRQIELAEIIRALLALPVV